MKCSAVIALVKFNELNALSEHFDMNYGWRCFVLLVDVPSKGYGDLVTAQRTSSSPRWRSFGKRMGNLPYEIRERIDSDGGLQLELFVESKRIASARAGADVFNAMKDQLNIDRQGVAEALRRALVDLLKNQLDQVLVSDPIEDSSRPLRFHARYTYRDHDNIDIGLVWYDVNTSDTGPDELPTIIRNKMRLEVHRKLTTDGGAARALVDIHA